MRRFAGYIFLSLLLFLTACQKEFSNEVSNNLSSGSLQSDVSGDCLPKTVAGVYEELVPVDGLTNTIDVTVDVTSPGTYKILTDTVNGFYFTATGIFTTTGTKTVTLKGAGTPLADGIANFTLTYGKSQCVVSVTVLPAGGSNPAVFTLAGTTTDCIDYELTGDFVALQPLTNANYVDIKVNVTAIGTYNVTTNTSNSFSFSGSGTFASIGPATIRLYATGTPSVAGTTNFPITVGSTSCVFQVLVFPAGKTATGTWSFTQGVTTYTGSVTEAIMDANFISPYLYFSFYGINTTTGDQILMELADASGAIQASGPQDIYDLSVVTMGNTGIFSFLSGGGSEYYADQFTTGNTFKITITGHNTTTKTITGTFSGKAEDINGVLQDITNGTFSVTYQ